MPLPNIELLAVQDAGALPQVMRWRQGVASSIAPSNIPVGASPFTYQNTLPGPASVMISGGTVTTISFSRDNVTYFLVGLLGGMFHLSPGDFLKVAYVLASTMTLIPF